MFIQLFCCLYPCQIMLVLIIYWMDYFYVCILQYIYFSEQQCFPFRL